MKPGVIVLAACAAGLFTGSVDASAGQNASVPVMPIAAAQDRAYPGEIRLIVDASDVERRIIRVREHIDGISANSVLLYPKWLPGHHAPAGPIDRFVGLELTSDGKPVSWTRDPVDSYAFRIHVKPGTHSIDIDFEYLAPVNTKEGSLESTRELLILDWSNVILYPAGYFARNIPVDVQLTLAADWKFATALEPISVGDAQTIFGRVNLDTLIDSPLYAGLYSLRLDLAPDGPVPVHMNLFADQRQFLQVTPEQLQAHRALVQQAYKLFNSRHYAHYDFLYALSDEVQAKGLEHHQSSEDSNGPNVFTDGAKNTHELDLLAHEFTHSWNGKFRRPADLWTPNFNVPMQGSLLWVYEGQTTYWGQVLAARAGLQTPQQMLDQLALTAAYYQVESGHRWRTLQDTTNDPLVNPRRSLPWRDWQRFQDYYNEGLLIWLDVDTLIRERSQNKRSLDDFASAFFGINDGSVTPVTYTFADVVKALNAVQPYDWTGFLRKRLDSTDEAAPLDGLRRGGYQLVYSDTPSDYAKSVDAQRKRVSLLFSLGMEIDNKDGSIIRVLWDSPAFKANLTEDTQILAINGIPYNEDVLKSAIRSAQNTKTPIQLIVKAGDRFRITALAYYGGLRYPHLERDASESARLDDILSPRR